MGERKSQRKGLENFVVIDAATFATSFSAFWQEYTPTCEHFVRRLNIAQLEREFKPMRKTKTADRAFLAESGFSLFVERVRHNLSLNDQLSDEQVSAAKIATKARLSGYARQGVKIVEHLTSDQNDEVSEIQERLYRFFSSFPDKILPRPLFNGCGYIDQSEADVIVGETLYEVKTVNRHFRSIDIRQLLTYAALNFSSRQKSIEQIGLFNPRIGVSFTGELDSICSDISGRSSQELFSMIVETISSGQISR